MKKRIRILSIIILAAALSFCAVFSSCSGEKDADNIAESPPIWVAVKSIGGDNGLFAEGQDYNFTLFFGYTSPSVQNCQIAVITVNDTDGSEIQTIVIDGFGDDKYNRWYKDTSAPTLELSYPAPENQPCTGALQIEIQCFEDEAAYRAGEDYCGTVNFIVFYLAESGVGTIIGSLGINELWERRCDMLLAEGKLTQDEYQREMNKRQ